MPNIGSSRFPVLLGNVSHNDLLAFNNITSSKTLFLTGKSLNPVATDILWKMDGPVWAFSAMMRLSPLCVMVKETAELKGRTVKLLGHLLDSIQLWSLNMDSDKNNKAIPPHYLN